ncbi:MAG TPA: DUF4157 domain-containing protein [Thermoanaerobaculia bacterium]|nr:DUF4157 domain-containing protein [Thermoanaerobaculia bacterium]
MPRDVADAVADAHAKVRVGYPWWLRTLLMRDVVGITLGRRIYLSAKAAPASAARLLRHELAHVRQINRLGLLRFYWRYMYEFGLHFARVRSISKAYDLISFEQEAVRAEHEPVVL